MVAAAATATATAVAVAGCTSEDPQSAPPPTAEDSSTSATPAPSPTTQTFQSQIQQVKRSAVPHSWRKSCPVPLSGLRLIEMTYWGFDDRPHTGQMVVNAKVAKDVAKVFRKLYRARYPIHKMKLVDAYKGSDFDSIEAGNTSAFNCRKATGSGSWSQHAYGLAVDLNPCENPYVAADGTVAHPRCKKYRNRDRSDPGVIHSGDRVVRAFASIGWQWGGEWSGIKDYQHFSSTGR